MKRIFIVLWLFCCFGISKGEAAWTNSGTYSANGGVLMVPLENKPTGILTWSNMKVLSLVNSGKASCKNCIFLQEVSNENVLLAEKTKFQDRLLISGGQTILTSCELNDIIIQNQDTPPFIQLDGNTHVCGSIVFEMSKGEVMVGPEVSLDGDIINGTLVAKKSD